MARRRSSGVTDLLSDIVDDIKDFLDDEIIDRGRDSERDLRRAGRNWTDSDDDSRGRSSRRSRSSGRGNGRSSGRGGDGDIENLRQAIGRLAAKVDSLADSGSGSADLPIAGYDDLTAVQVNERLASLSQSDLERVDRYERANADRTTVTGRIDSLRGEQPWDGYDEQTVVEIRKALTGTSKATAGEVESYEAAHKNRQGVLEAAETAQNS